MKEKQMKKLAAGQEAKKLMESQRDLHVASGGRASTFINIDIRGVLGFGESGDAAEEVSERSGAL